MTSSACVQMIAFGPSGITTCRGAAEQSGQPVPGGPRRRDPVLAAADGLLATWKLFCHAWSLTWTPPGRSMLYDRSRNVLVAAGRSALIWQMNSPTAPRSTPPGF